MTGQQRGDVLLIGNAPLAEALGPHIRCGRLNDIAVFIEDDQGEFRLGVLDSFGDFIAANSLAKNAKNRLI